MNAAPPISVQLYSLREEVAVDFPAVLSRLGAKGYAGVELAGFGALTPQQLADALARAGLAVSSAHVGYAGADEFPPDRVGKDRVEQSMEQTFFKRRCCAL